MKWTKIAAGVAATLALTWLSTPVASFAATTPAASTVAPKTLVALGDSITFGYNLNDTEGNTVPSKAYAFPYLIGAKDDLQVTDLGIPGWTSADLVNAVHSANFLSAVHGAAVITLDIGSNDLLRWAADSGLLADAEGTTVPTLTLSQKEQVAGILAQFGKNFAETMASLRLVTSAPIVVYNLYDPFPSISPLHAVAEPLLAVENREIATIAGLYKNVAVANAYAAFDGHQLTYVRVLEGDVHPTILGQTVLARIGEQALAPLLAKEPPANAFSGVTDLMAGEVSTAGGSLTGTVNGTKLSFAVPAKSLNQGTEVAVTSQEPESGAVTGSLPFAGAKVAEVGLNFMAGTTFAKPYTLTITNPNITKNSLVFALSGMSITFVGSARVSQGQAVVTGVRSADYIVLSLPAWW